MSSILRRRIVTAAGIFGMVCILNVVRVDEFTHQVPLKSAVTVIARTAGFPD